MSLACALAMVAQISNQLYRRFLTCRAAGKPRRSRRSHGSLLRCYAKQRSHIDAHIWKCLNVHCITWPRFTDRRVACEMWFTINLDHLLGKVDQPNLAYACPAVSRHLNISVIVNSAVGHLD